MLVTPSRHCQEARPSSCVIRSCSLSCRSTKTSSRTWLSAKRCTRAPCRALIWLNSWNQSPEADDSKETWQKAMGCRLPEKIWKTYIYIYIYKPPWIYQSLAPIFPIIIKKIPPNHQPSWNASDVFMISRGADRKAKKEPRCHCLKVNHHILKQILAPKK